MELIVCPSLLAADWANLQQECERVAAYKGAPVHLHMDVMDGHFVPNISIGAPVIKSLRKRTSLFIDCHLMVSDPLLWVAEFAKAGANGFTFHIEATEDPIGLINEIKKHKMRAGVAIKPKTSLTELNKVVIDGEILADMVLVMTVEPGFGGQKFMVDQLKRVAELRRRFIKLNIQVDGGVGPENARECISSGANLLVAGSSIFSADDVVAVMHKLIGSS